MPKDRPIYVIDTNILVDYVDVIPGEEGEEPYEPTIDLSEAHLVIPTVVVRELSNFKGEKSDRGKAARLVLRRLRDLCVDDVQSIDEVYRLQAPLEMQNGKQLISILPVHRDFWKSLPFHPSDRDMDGQIILTALAAVFLQNGIEIDGTAKFTGERWTVDAVRERKLNVNGVTLLTNDNGLAIRARERGLMTSRYGYKYPAPYTGRREIMATKELFAEFINSSGEGVTREFFEEQMPNEPKLVANEFVVMGLAGPEDLPVGYRPDEDPYYRYVGRYDAEFDAIVPLQYVREFPTPVNNVGQAIYAEALMSPEIAAVICTGPAGSGKTYMATVFGYEACQDGSFMGVTVVPCENRSNIGALPGDLDEKMDPDVQPLKNALRNFLIHNDPKLSRELATFRKFGPGKAATKKGKSKKKAKDNDDALISQQPGQESPGSSSPKAKLNDRVNLIWDNWFSSVPIDNARGRDFAYELAIYDEFQDQNAVQADTLLKRLGYEGKIILTGDIMQIHAPYLDQSNNGLVYASRLLYDNPMVAQVCFTEDEVVRHPLVKAIARRQKSAEFDAEE